MYSLTAISSESRLLICHHEGGRTIEDAIDLFTEIEKRRVKGSALPVFVSDNWDAFANALLEVYGVRETPEYKGIGRKPHPILIPPIELKYAQIMKNRVNCELVSISQRIVYGDPKEVMELLSPMSKGHINTAYAERINLSFRNHLARFIRKAMNFSKDREIHSKAIDFFQAWYNFVKPHDSLKLEINLDMEEVGFNLNTKKWLFQTPAMFELITDHIWTLRELMTWRTPIQ